MERAEACPQGGIPVVRFFSDEAAQQSGITSDEDPAAFEKVDETFFCASRLPLIHIIIDALEKQQKGGEEKWGAARRRTQAG